MPPGKHKSKLKSALIQQMAPIPLFLSRQGSHIDGPFPDNNILPLLSISRQRSIIPDIDQQFSTKLINIDIFIQQENKTYNIDQHCKVTQDGKVWLYDLIKSLKESGQDGTDKIKNSTIQILNEEETQQLSRNSIIFKVNNSIYTPNLPVYENIGIDPLEHDSFYQLQDDQQKLKIKIRPSKNSLLETILEQNPNEEEISEKKQKTKQRSLSQVVERVALWRRLYTGFYDQNKTFVQMSLDKAAEKVGISKKTLDDYLLQIRYGKRYGFDFKKHCNEGISKLRQFVKSKKENKKNDT